MTITFEQHIIKEQSALPGASSEFSWLMSGVTLATKMIQADMRRAALAGILGSVGESNPQGEMLQMLDVYANEVLINCLSQRESVGVIASEENESPIAVGHDPAKANYAVVFDPIDGSSNIGVAVSDGTGRVLDLIPKSLHQHTPLVVGGRVEMEEFERLGGGK